MGELTDKENMMQNFDTIDKEIFEKKQQHGQNLFAVQGNPYFPQSQFNKTIRLSSEIDKIWNSKHNPEFINKIFM